MPPKCHIDHGHARPFRAATTDRRKGLGLRRLGGRCTLALAQRCVFLYCHALTTQKESAAECMGAPTATASTQQEHHRHDRHAAMPNDCTPLARHARTEPRRTTRKVKASLVGNALHPLLLRGHRRCSGTVAVAARPAKRERDPPPGRASAHVASASPDTRRQLRTATHRASGLGKHHATAPQLPRQLRNVTPARPRRE